MGRKAILIGEDNPENREILKAILQDSYNIIEAKNGGEAYDLIIENQENLSLILLDMLMPMKDGIEILRELKQIQNFDVPIIFVTAMQSEVIETDSIEAGAVAYIRKPFSAEDILAKVAAHIK